MDVATYAAEAEAVETHWWFAGRRALFAREIAQLGLDRDGAVLDVGTSTGTNLRMLAEQGYRNVRGLDASEESIRWCAAKGLAPVHKGDVCAIPFPDGTFDLVLATDVIEHVDDDGAALREIRRVLKAGGHALITVPAFKSLWGLQDVVAHHKRRYRLGQLRAQVAGAGLDPVRRYYFNFLLFLPILAARQAIKLLKPEVRSENDINSPVLNRILTAVFAFDVRLAPVLRPPFGVSALVLARRLGS